MECLPGTVIPQFEDLEGLDALRCSMGRDWAQELLDMDYPELDKCWIQSLI